MAVSSKDESTADGAADLISGQLRRTELTKEALNFGRQRSEIGNEKDHQIEPPSHHTLLAYQLPVLICSGQQHW